MTLNVKLNLVNGQQIFVIPGGTKQNQQLIFACGAYPGAGTLTLEYQQVGSSLWLPGYHAQMLSLAAPLVLETDGGIARYRVTLAGIVGGADLEAWLVDNVGQAFPPGSFTGFRALTTQPYTEANVKRGVQFYARAAWPLGAVIPAAGQRKLFFQTGAKQVVVKLRDFQYVAEELRVNLYRTPTGVTGGTDITIHNYNGVNPVATTVSGKKDVATGTDGIEFDGGDPEYFFGGGAVGQRTASSIPQGRERVLPPNSTFLVVITNTGTGDARAQYYLDWYEGSTDIP